MKTCCFIFSLKTKNLEIEKDTAKFFFALYHRPPQPTQPTTNEPNESKSARGHGVNHNES